MKLNETCCLCGKETDSPIFVDSFYETGYKGEYVLCETCEKEKEKRE
jgi:hypothetical protein